MTWQYVSDIAGDISGEIRYAYAAVVDLGQSHLLATTGSWWGRVIALAGSAPAIPATMA